MGLFSILRFRGAAQGSSKSLGDRLTPEQRKTVTVLKRLGEEGRTARLELLRAAPAPIPPLPKPSTAATRGGTGICVSLPVSFPARVRKHLRALTETATDVRTALRFSRGNRFEGRLWLSVGDPEKKHRTETEIGTFDHVAIKTPLTGTTPVGIVFSLKEAAETEGNDKQAGKQHRLHMSIRYSPATVLRNPAHKDLGDLSYRARIAAPSAAKIKKTAPPGRARSSALTAAATAATEKRIGELVDQIVSPEEMGDVLGLTAPQLDDVAWHDFSAYEYALEPDYLPQPLPAGPSALSSGLASDLQSPELELFLRLLRDAVAVKYAGTASVKIRVGGPDPPSTGTDQPSGNRTFEPEAPPDAEGTRTHVN